jgi:NTE family protein
LTNDYVSLYADARADTFDDGYFPTKGFKAGASYSWTFAGFPSDFNHFNTIQADAKVVVPIGERIAFIPAFNARFLLGDHIPVPYFNAVGGSLSGRYLDQQIQFYGINKLAAMKNILTVYKADFRVKIARNHYASAIANYARDCNLFKEYAIGPGHCGLALEYSYDTIVGPLSVNINWSSITRKPGFYISAGFDF